jgi:hypothetical protein
MSSIAIILVNNNIVNDRNLNNICTFALKIKDVLILNFNYNNTINYHNNIIKIQQYLKLFKNIKLDTILFYIDNELNENLDTTYSSFDFFKMLSNFNTRYLITFYKSKINFTLPLFKYYFSFYNNAIHIDYNDISLGSCSHLLIIDNYDINEFLKDLLRSDGSITLYNLLLDNSFISIYSDKIITRDHKLFDTNSSNILSILRFDNSLDVITLLSYIYPIVFKKEFV